MEANAPPAQWFALLAGVFLAALGVLTLVLNNLSWGSTTNPSEFLLWKASGWNTILWMAMGVIGIFASTSLDAARTYGLVAGAVFAVLAVWGFIDAGFDTMGIFAIGTTGNITHAVIAGLGLITALMPESAQRKAGVGTSPPGHAA